MSFHRKPWPRVGFLLLAIIGLARSEEPDRVYSLAEVAVIDRENKMWRAVDVTRTVEANVERLLAAGCPAAEVDALKSRLTIMWKVEPWLHFGWLAPGTAERIEELTPEFSVRLKEARVREMLNRLGGHQDPLTSAQVYAQWRSAIHPLLDDREREDVVLLNSAPALALYGLMKGVPLTVAERRSLCRLQQDHLGTNQQAAERRAFPLSGRVTPSQAEALLDYWQQMRDLLGDDRFAVYLQAAEARFARMAGVLLQVDGVTPTKALELWWVRKKDELADLRGVVGLDRNQLKIQAEESATEILGSDTLQVYLADEDGRWLRRYKPGRIFGKGQVAQKGSQAE